jgi:hypothetical protein
MNIPEKTGDFTRHLKLIERIGGDHAERGPASFVKDD